MDTETDIEGNKIFIPEEKEIISKIIFSNSDLRYELIHLRQEIRLLNTLLTLFLLIIAGYLFFSVLIQLLK